MKFSESLKKNKDFRTVYSRGLSYANRYLVVYLIENGQDSNRIGISVSKKVGNSIVRHRITRQLREIYRLNEGQVSCGYDIVVIARNSSKGKDYHTLEKSFIHLLKLHHIFKFNKDD